MVIDKKSRPMSPTKATALNTGVAPDSGQSDILAFGPPDSRTFTKVTSGQSDSRTIKPIILWGDAYDLN